MIFGFNDVPFEMVILPNDDEEAPIAMTGKKMLPILETPQSKVIDESLDIVHHIAEIHGSSCLDSPRDLEIESWVEKASKTIYELAIPRWAYSDFPEFESLSARQYFIDKKQGVFGDFSTLVGRTPSLVNDVNQYLLELDTILQAKKESITGWSVSDVILYPVIRSLSIVKGVEWPGNVDAWRHRLAIDSGVPLHDKIAL